MELKLLEHFTVIFRCLAIQLDEFFMVIEAVEKFKEIRLQLIFRYADDVDQLQFLSVGEGASLCHLL